MKPQQPLKPTFVNERARIEEHDSQMAWARRQYGTNVICPDCYAPPSKCSHTRPYDRRKT